ncbi:SURF6 and DUF2217 domain containing protein [Trichuris trichiura]|uniref:SURF6 and DUF2217 domain containing protein n=1 Tax=Trichuris trichiura TaxID=36087 RepID=A0A077ZDP9_TRITR|nr:SURF6 and DUF2217 domain containing protein [Trichuris trichiura]
MLFEDSGKREWVTKSIRDLLCFMLKQSNSDVEEFCSAYDRLIDFCTDVQNERRIASELGERKVPMLSFYDVVSDFIILDAMDEMTHPPGAILAVVRNPILPGSTKEKILASIATSVIASKRNRLTVKDGFLKQFYDVMETVAPMFAWSLLGSDDKLRELFGCFRGHIVTFHSDIFNEEVVRFTDVGELAEDIWTVLQRHMESVNSKMTKRDPGSTKMADNLERILQLDAKFLRTLDMIDPAIYGFDETTKNYLRFVDYKLKTGQAKKQGRQGMSKERERKPPDVYDCGSVRTISYIWKILAESDPVKVASAAVKNFDIPDELLLGYSENKDAELSSTQKIKMKAKSKGKGKQKGKKEKKLRHAKKQLVARSDHEPTPSRGDEGNINRSIDKLAYNKFEFAGNSSLKKKHRKRGKFAVDNLVGHRYSSLLRKVEQRQEKLETLQEKDPAKAEAVTRKIRWDTAERRAQGVKIKDDPSLLKKGLKRRLKKKERSRKQWAERVSAVERAMQKKQEIRRKNIRRRIEQKKKFRAKEHL